MAVQQQTFDLGRMRLSSGEGRRIDLDVPIEPMEFGGQRYPVRDGRVAARLDISRPTTGWSLRLRFGAQLDGPCMRCLEPAGAMVDVDARELNQPHLGEELSSPYIEEDELDLSGWARDSLVLALPVQIVCREECRGLCAVCGANLNEDPEHAHEKEPDPRWAALRGLKLDG
jgi:uncharacterized protein